MLCYLKYSESQGIITTPTKDYQYEPLSCLFPDYAKSKYRIARIGADLYLVNLLKLRASGQYVIDPYQAGPGGGANNPPDFPEDLFVIAMRHRHDIGHLPDDFFDMVFSSSLLQHVGQVEVSHDVSPAFTAAQGPLGDAFRAELFRILEPGQCSTWLVQTSGGRSERRYRPTLQRPPREVGRVRKNDAACQLRA